MRLISLLLLAAAAFAADKPNIVLIVVDDLGYAELSCQGARDLPTPHIDSIAENGVRFTSGYVSGPVCCPSRAGFMTGRMQTRFGHELNAIGVQNLGENIGLPLSEKTIATRLKQAGYRTGLFGKWHLGAHASKHPLSRGFDEFYGFLNEGHYFKPEPYEGVATWLRIASTPPGVGTRIVRGRFIFSSHMGYDEPTYDVENPIYRGRQPIREERYLTDALADEAIEFIERAKGGPFFLNLSMNAPHSPMQAADAYMDRHAAIEDVHRRIFVGMVTNLDDAIGRVLAKLRQVGVEEDTLIFFFSDNGGPTKELTSSNAPLREGKGRVYEGGLRVPFLAQWKAKLPQGKIDRRAVTALDFAATAMAAAGEDVPPELDGVDLAPYLTGDNHRAPHETLFWRYGSRIALRHKDWKMVGLYDDENGPHDLELYNLAADLGETTDLAAKSPAAAGRLREMIADYDAQMVPPLWRGDRRSRPTRTNVPLKLWGGE